jgi:amidohydrolase
MCGHPSVADACALYTMSVWFSSAQNSGSAGMGVRKQLTELSTEMRRWRQHFHANPETAFEERNTAEFVARLLSEWGIPIHRGLAETGVVGTLSAGNSGRAIALRADMDALHLEERGHVGYRSRNHGKMHACGHDGHMAMLLGAAHYLAHTRQFDGVIHFIFQPAEENEAGGRRMISEGLFELFPVQAVFGMHNMPHVAQGKFAIRPGPVMASADFFEVTILGKGGHGAWPHTTLDAIGIASEIVLGFNQIVSRTVDPLQSAVISVTRINAGHTTNVIPEAVVFAGTTRAFSLAVQNHLEERMERLCRGIAAAHGVQVQFVYQRRYPPTVNHIQESELAAQAAAGVVGEKNVLRDEFPVMGAEDFGWMLLERPGSYIWIGGGTGQDACMLHDPMYDFNDHILPIGASYWVEVAERALSLR